jgi:hypothetical protein
LLAKAPPIISFGESIPYYYCLLHVTDIRKRMSFLSPMSESRSPEIIVRRRNGLPLEYSCPFPRSENITIVSSRAGLANESFIYGLQSIEVNYAYEFTIVDPNESIEEIMTQDVASLEYAFLYLVAKATSLLNCSFDSQNIDAWASTPPQADQGYLPYLVTLSSDPGDEISNVDGTFSHS